MFHYLTFYFTTFIKILINLKKIKKKQKSKKIEYESKKRTTNYEINEFK